MAESHASMTPATLPDIFVQSIYQTGELFEAIALGLRRRINAWAKSRNAALYHFPPIMQSEVLRRSGYYKNFPHFVGSVSCLPTDELAAHSYSSELNCGSDQCAVATGLALTPAACYPIYPMVASAGALPVGGVVCGAFSYCFRREPSTELSRLQSFRMQEVICIGDPTDVKEFREQSIRFAEELVGQLSLTGDLVVANDPFFGRVGRLIGEAQRASQYKFELVLPVSADESEVACMSFNYHADHFGNVWGIKTSLGETAHSACFAVGIERLVLAILHRHGQESSSWSDSIRSTLSLK